ncbi:MAG: hypothetical protein HYX94_00605 [Chloroflexi bacterium]|nr:hypothetical protein [Chloroflexota bacterium]
MQNSWGGRLLQDEKWRRKAIRLAVDLVSLALLTLLFRSALALAIGGDSGCANTGVQDAYQPRVMELSNALASAASGNLGTNYEPIGSLWSGYPNQSLVPASIPCTILKSIAYIESGWRQASTAPRGSSGEPLVSYSCGYGVMQITSPMTAPGPGSGLLDPARQQRVAREYTFNVSYGAKMLVDKWNWTPVIGGNNPAILENWYYAVWAYNGWTWKNNPNNPSYDPFRPQYNGSPGQSYLQYPYQELVWGRAANPPTIDGIVAWTRADITLPPSNQITNPPGQIADPQLTHTETCSSTPPPTLTPTPTRTATPTYTPTPTAMPLPLLQASTNYIGFLAEPGQTPGPQTLTLTGNRSSIVWSVQSPPPWITAVPTGGESLPASVRISAGPWSTPDSRSGSIRIQNAHNPSQNNLLVSIYQYLGSLSKLRFPLVYR